MREGIEANRLSNALSVALLVCLLPAAALGEHLYLGLSLAAFACVAALNHLWPTRLRRLTHVVKACYTHVLAASLSIHLEGSLAPLAALVSLFDLLPLGLPAGRVRALCEALGGTLRWIAIVVAIVLLEVPWPLLLGLAFCSGAYWHERRTRIAAGRRDDYGYLHIVEHLGVWLLLVFLNAELLDFVRVARVSLAVIAAVAVGLVGLGIASNLRALRGLEAELPPWFDPRLRPFIAHKIRANLYSHRWQHYVMKPFSPKMTNMRICWSDIEAMVEGIELQGRYDLAVGVLSGGAFIASYVAKKRGIEELAYIRSRLWSKLSLFANVRISARYYLGRPIEPVVEFLDEDLELGGRRVLVIDDSVCTGATMKTVVDRCYERGAREVSTLALFCNAEHSTDYCYRESMTPLVWPWGWESD